jgi:hypothetical protein
MSSFDQYELLRRLAYAAWLDRGQPIGSPEVDWQRAVELLDVYSQPENQSNVNRAPVLSDAITVVNRIPSIKPQRGRVRSKPKNDVPTISTVSNETPPVEVPPTSPAPPPPTPTQASAIA